MAHRTASIRRHRMLLALVIGLVPHATSAQVRLGPELQVNTSTTGHQTFPAVGFVVTWHDNGGHDGHGHGIFAQVFAQDLVFRDGFE